VDRNLSPSLTAQVKAPLVMSVEENYPIPIKEKVIANLKRWGFT
jgi:hypothetical protein